MDEPAQETAPERERWWLPPLLHVLAVLVIVLVIGGIIALVLRSVNTPPADELLSRYGYLGIAVGAFADSFGLPSSGEIVVLLGSAAAATGQGNFNLPTVIGVAWFFAVLGDATAYALGRAAGPRVLVRFGVHHDSKVHRFMDRYGMGAVVLARSIAGIRTKVAVVSGSTEMPLLRYVLADAIGAAIWAIGLGVLGYVFADSVHTLIDRFETSSGTLGAIAITGAALGALYLSVQYIRSHRPGRRH
jgi:membrane protein DedA with SNARE-associated domain